MGLGTINNKHSLFTSDCIPFLFSLNTNSKRFSSQSCNNINNGSVLFRSPSTPCGVKERRLKQHQYPETEAAMNSAIIHFIVYTCAYPTVTFQISKVLTNCDTKSIIQSNCKQIFQYVRLYWNNFWVCCGWMISLHNAMHQKMEVLLGDGEKNKINFGERAPERPWRTKGIRFE